MPDKIDTENYDIDLKVTRYRFHPFVRGLMILLSSVALCYSVYFIVFLIPKTPGVTTFFKAVSVIILYVSLSTLYKHLTSLNSIRMSEDDLVFTFLLRKRITIPWGNLVGMEIYKAVIHYWKVAYIDSLGNKKTFKTSLAFPGIMNILIQIHNRKNNLEMNELLSKVLEYKTKLATQNEESLDS